MNGRSSRYNSFFSVSTYTAAFSVIINTVSSGLSMLGRIRPLPTLLFITFYGVLLAEAQNGAQLPRNGLIGYFPYTNGNPNNTIGYFPNVGNNDNEIITRFNGVLVGAAPGPDLFNYANNSIHFNGLSTYIIGQADGLPTADRTIAFLVNPTAALQESILFTYPKGTFSIQLIGSAEGNTYKISNGFKSHDYFVTEGGDRWMHFAVAISNQFILLNINGEPAKDPWWGKTLYFNNDIGYSTLIPRKSNYLVGYNFTGDLDELVIYNRQLDSTELSAVYKDALADRRDPQIKLKPSTENLVKHIPEPIYFDKWPSLNGPIAFLNSWFGVRGPADDFPTGPRTISFWHTDMNEQSTLLEYGKGFSIRINGGSWMRPSDYNGYEIFRGSDDIFMTGNRCYGVLDTYSWSHFAFVSSDWLSQIYYNGKPQSGYGNVIKGTQVNGTEFILGQGYSGKISDFRVYNRGLLREEIEDIFYDNKPTTETKQESNLFAKGILVFGTGLTFFALYKKCNAVIVEQPTQKLRIRME